MALMFIWVAFMAGMKISKVASKAVDPFKKMGAKIGEFGAKLPTYAPIPGTGTSMAGLSKVADKLEQKFESAQQDKIANSGLGKFAGMTPSVNEKLRDSFDRLPNNLTVADYMKKHMALIRNEPEANQYKTAADTLNAARDKFMTAGADGKYTVTKDTELRESLKLQ